MDFASAAAKKEKALRRPPLSLTALYLGAKGRPAADYQDTCILVQRYAGALGLIYLNTIRNSDSYLSFVFSVVYKLH